MGVGQQTSTVHRILSLPFQLYMSTINNTNINEIEFPCGPIPNSLKRRLEATRVLTVPVVPIVNTVHSATAPLPQAVPQCPSVQFKASPLPNMARLQARIQAAYIINEEPIVLPQEPCSPTFAPISFTFDDEPAPQKPKHLLDNKHEDGHEDESEVFLEVAVELLTARLAVVIVAFLAAVCTIIHSFAIRLRDRLTADDNKAVFIEEVTHLSCLLDTLGYEGEHFISAVCPPLMPTAWNIVALVIVPKDVPAPSISQRLLNSAQAIITKVSATVTAKVSGFFIMLCRLINDMAHSAGFIKSDFEYEINRLGCLLDSFECEPFVSSVCPPLMPSPFNQVSIIPMFESCIQPEPQTGIAHTYAYLLEKMYSIATESGLILFGIAAAFITFSP